MCLLITKPADSNFDEPFLHGVYQLNSDGIGVMYAEDGKVVVRKFLPKNAIEALAFYRENIQGRACAVHYRMRTHGATDLANCHPYQVISAEEGYELWLMHNGVLHTGNAKDVLMSDTWHYIQDYLRPILLNNPTFFLTEAFKDLIGDHIGTGNKFTLVDALGNVVTVNEEQGVKFEGAWLSNTYAWETQGRKFTYCAPFKGGTSFSRYGSALGTFDAYDYPPVGAYYGRDATGAGSLNDIDDADYDAYMAMESWADTIMDYLDSISDAYVDMSYGRLYAFYRTAGDTAAWDFLDYITASELDENSVLHYLNMDAASIREVLGVTAESDIQTAPL